MTRQRSVVTWTALWYGSLVVAGFLSEWARLVWPYSFMLVLGLDSWIAFYATCLLGAALGIGMAWLVERRSTVKSVTLAAVLGLISLVLALGAALFVAWNVAEFYDWPIGP